MGREQVIDNERETRYEMRTEAGLALLDYMREDGRIALVHTEVPKALEGRGFGTMLVKAALDEARARQVHVIPMCAFVRAYIARHPEYAALVAKR